VVLLGSSVVCGLESGVDRNATSAKLVGMRTVCLLLVASLLFSGCGSYYQKVNQDSIVDPNPRAYFDVGDEALLVLSDGASVGGTVEAIRTDSITIDERVIEWSEVATVGKSKYRVAATIAFVAVIAAVVVVVVAIDSFFDGLEALSEGQN
jgi:hypothetical protein